MEEKKYLNEENYQKTVKKLKIIALIIFVIGLLIGGSLIASGIVNIFSDKNIGEEIVGKYEENNNTESTNNRTEEEVQNEINLLTQEISKLEVEEDKEFTTNGFSDEYYRIQAEITQKKQQKTTLSMELIKIQNSNFSDNVDNETKESVNSIFGFAGKIFNVVSGLPLIMFGGTIIAIALIISIPIYLFAKKRDIIAFSAQQRIPVTKEIVEETTPTMAKAAGTIGKEIAKGISEGLKEGLDDKEN